MRRITVARILAIFAVIIGLLSGGAATSAFALQQTANTDTTQCTWEWTRTIPVPHQEYKYEKTVPAVEGVKEFKYKKLIEGTPAGPDLWWVWAPNDTKGPQDYEPAFPEDDRGKWVGPKENGGPRQDTFGTFQTSDNGNSNWFHREHGTPGTEDSWEESEWTTEVRGEPWVLVDERWKVEPQPEQTVLYKDGAWTTDILGEPWVKVDERTVNGDEFIAQGPVRSSQEPDRGDYPDVAWKKVPGSEKCTDTPPVDVCPNLDGNQPEGTDCTPDTPPVDVCPNLDGNQPKGTDCTPDTPPTTTVTDKCPDMKGVQGPEDKCVVDSSTTWHPPTEDNGDETYPVGLYAAFIGLVLLALGGGSTAVAAVRRRS